MPPFDSEDTTPRNSGNNNDPNTAADVDMGMESPHERFRRDHDSPPPDHRDRFGRDRRSRSRSRSPVDMRMSRHRSRSPMRGGDDGGDRYGSHYDRERDRDRGSDRYHYRGRGNRSSYNRGDGDGSYGGRQSNMADPRSFEQVVPFKYFAEWVKTQDNGRRLEQDEIRERYEDYRRDALQRLYTQFFNEHKDDDWFDERFNPDRCDEYKKMVAEHKAMGLRGYMADLETGKYDDFTLTATTEQLMQNEVNRRDPTSYNRLGASDEVEDDTANAAIRHTLFIRTVPPTVARTTLENEVKDQPGFRYLVLSEPRQDKQFQRFGWVRFEEGTDMDKVLENLGNVVIDQFQFHFTRHSNNSGAPMRLCPDVASTDDRLRRDLKLVREAVKSKDERTDPEAFHSFDTIQAKAKELSEAAGENNATMASGAMANDQDEDEDGAVAAKDNDEREMAEMENEEDGVNGSYEAVRRELDLMIEYLRRVHFYCYYCGHTAENAEDFGRRCAKQHLRRILPAGRTPQPSGNWTRNLDNRNDVIIHPLEGERLDREGGKSLDRETDRELDKHVNRLDEGRFRCMICNKLFKGDEFVRKHIRNKHPDKIPDTLVREISFFNNFVRDAPHFVQLGTGGTLAPNMAAGGAGMRGDRGGGFMPQMMPGMMIPGMMAAPYMVPGMVPAGMMPGMVPGMMNAGMVQMGGGGGYNPSYRGRHSNGRGSAGGRGDTRSVRSYVDLDAPAEGNGDFGF